MKKAGTSKNDLESALAWLESHGTKRYRDQMAERFAIHTDKAFGTSMADVKQLAKVIGKDHELALALWRSGWHEARALAAHVADPKQMTPTLMDAWCKDFSNWADCDTACSVLFDRTPHAFKKIQQWASRKPEFQKRAAFALLASVALHDKKTADTDFIACLPLIRSAANDERNFVKKGVSWALRGIAGRSPSLREAVIELAEGLAASENATERWVGRDVLRDVERPLIAKRAEKRNLQRTKTTRK